MDQNETQTLNRGAILKQAREEKGLSLEIVHEATKIPMDVIKALEEGYTTRSMSPFYYRGFLKIYASYLNVDTSQVIEEVKDERLKFKKGKTDYEPFDWQEYISRFFTQRRKQQIIIGLGVVLALFVLFRLISWIASHRPAPKPKTAKVSHAAEKKIPKPEVTQMAAPRTIAVESVAVIPPVEAAVESVEQNNIAMISPAQGVNLTIRTRKSSWLRVKADDKVVFQGSLKGGAVETWNASKQIEISGKNIQNLEFELNGKTIGSLGQGGSKAKVVVVTAEGLTVTK